jgi:hypothetical protein
MSIFSLDLDTVKTSSVSLGKGKMHEINISPLPIHFPLGLRQLGRRRRAPTYPIMNTKKKGGETMNTATYQQEIEGFVSREVYVCQTALIEEAFRQQLITVDEIYNLYRPFDGRLIDPSVCYKCKNEFLCLDSETGECEGCFEANKEPQEIFEWWVVSLWLGRKLLIEGEPVIENSYGIWWGRTTTGQAISLDYIIGKIYGDIASYSE